MLKEIAESMNKKTPITVKSTSGTAIFRCSRADCRGYAYHPDMLCTLCRVPIDKEVENSSMVVNREVNGAPPCKQSRVNGRQILAPILILSIGKAGIFDARNGPCIISTNSLSCRVKLEGSWVAVTMEATDIQSLVFCEELQVVFLKPRDRLKENMATVLKLGSLNTYDPATMKWIILVLGDRMTHSPEKNVLVPQMEIFGSSIRANDGFCKMDCTWTETRSLLLDCGLRLPRAEARAQATDCNARSPVSPTKPDDQPANKMNHGCSASTVDAARPKPDGGLLTNVINTLSSAGMHIFGSMANSATGNAQHLSDPEGTDSGSKDTDREDMIILCEEESESAEDSEPIPGASEPAANSGQKGVNHDGSETPFKFDYRPPGSTDSVTLTSADLECLAPGALINDAIINFYLKYLYFEQLSELQRSCTYLFNCFFYSRLAGVTPTAPAATTTTTTVTTPTTRSHQRQMVHDSATADESSPASNPQSLSSIARHANVAKWTRRVDLFRKDYIIIPINEASHWFLGLVCYPWMAGMVSYTALYKAEAFDMCKLNEEYADVDQYYHHHACQADVDDRTVNDEPIESMPGDTEGMAFDRWRRRRLAWLRKRGINAMPCILLFDSLPCQTRVSNLHVIREYLQAEWDSRRAAEHGPLYFNKDTIRGFSPRVPSQSNLVDCGIYLLHYVEMFFKKPVQSYTKDYFQNEMASWFSEATVGEKRSEMSNLVKQLHQRSLAPPPPPP